MQKLCNFYFFSLSADKIRLRDFSTFPVNYLQIKFFFNWIKNLSWRLAWLALSLSLSLSLTLRHIHGYTHTRTSTTHTLSLFFFLSVYFNVIFFFNEPATKEAATNWKKLWFFFHNSSQLCKKVLYLSQMAFGCTPATTFTMRQSLVLYTTTSRGSNLMPPWQFTWISQVDFFWSSNLAQC